MSNLIYYSVLVHWRPLGCLQPRTMNNEQWAIKQWTMNNERRRTRNTTINKTLIKWIQSDVGNSNSIPLFEIALAFNCDISRYFCVVRSPAQYVVRWHRTHRRNWTGVMTISKTLSDEDNSAEITESSVLTSACDFRLQTTDDSNFRRLDCLTRFSLFLGMSRKC